MTIRSKIVGMVVASVAVAATAPVVALMLNQRPLVEGVNGELREMGYEQAERLTHAVFEMVEAQHEMLLAQTRRDLHAAEALLERTGALALDDSHPVSWNAVNQFTKAAQPVELPAVLVGGSAIEPVRDFASAVPVVDATSHVTEGTCTIFQRMNDAGDMLRIATTVRQPDGGRAIGTYIPATGPDGKPNVVVAALLRGETYLGRAWVVDRWCITAYMPLKDSAGRIIGALYAGRQAEENNHLRQAIMSIRVGKTGYVYVLGARGDEKHRYIISQGGKRDGEDLSQVRDSDGNLIILEQVEKAVAANGEAVRLQYPWKNAGDTEPRVKVVAARYFEPWGWVIGSGTYVDEFQEASGRIGGAVWTVLWQSAAAALVALLAFSGLAWLLAKRIVRPMAHAVDLFRNLAEGEGDLTKRLEVVTKDEAGELARWFNTFADKVHDLVAAVAGCSREVASSATQLAAATEEMAQGAAQQTKQADEVVSAAQQMSEAVTEVAKQSASAASTAREAGQAATDGGQVVHQAKAGIDALAEVVAASATAINQLGQRSEEIGQIIGVINDIADQTNLLALNAAIEAARAGEHGRGFAVVADEVRKLADRTTKATGEIAQSIQSIQGETSGAVHQMEQGTTRAREGVELVQRTGDSLTQIVERSARVTGMIEAIAAAAEEQSATAGQITGSMQGIMAVSRESAEGAGQSATATAALSQQAERLQGLVARFKLREATRA